MLYLSFLTPNTCCLTPSTSNLINAIATASKRYVLRGHFILEVVRFLLHNVVFSEVMRSAQEKITSWLRAELLLRASQSWAAKMLSFFQPITERNYIRLGDAISKTIWSEEFQNYFLVPVRIQFGPDLENPWWIPKWITTYIHPI